MLSVVKFSAPEKNTTLGQDCESDDKQDVLHDILQLELVQAVCEELAALLMQVTDRFDQHPNDADQIRELQRNSEECIIVRHAIVLRLERFQIYVRADLPSVTLLEREIDDAAQARVR